MREWINYAGAVSLILVGAGLYSVDSDFPTAGTPVLALPLVVAGLVWVAMALRRRFEASQRPDGRGGREGR